MKINCSYNKGPKSEAMFPFPQFAVLGGLDWRTRGTLLYIADWKETPNDQGRRLLKAKVLMNIATFSFGYPFTRTTFFPYILQLPDGSYDVYRPWQWNHLCFAWSSGGKSKIVLVNYQFSNIQKVVLKKCLQNGEFLNVNYTDENLKDLKVPVDLLLKVHIMTCPNDFEKDCTAPGAQATDFNIWSRSFNDQELIDWTSCK